MSWLVYRRGTIHPFRAAVPLWAIKKFSRHDYCGAKQPETLYINENDKLYWSWNQEEFQIFGRKLLVFIQSPQRFKAHRAILDQQIADALSASQKIVAADLTKLSNEQLINRLVRFLDVVAPAHFSLNAEIDAVDFFWPILSGDRLSVSFALKLAPVWRKYSML